ncbi:MAG: hypothetical protein JWQ15_658 [Marmoricola sp.]|nr:hypothetical protein [Marmoricola sp.]
MKPPPIVTYPLRRARSYGQELARSNALVASVAAATRRADREEARRFLDEELPSSEGDARNRKIQQFLDDRLAGIPSQRSGEDRPQDIITLIK